ncbi:MAG: ArsR family transcriptional regulator [Verrucomicrobiota bacterium]
MSDTPHPAFSVEDLARILSEPARWHLLRELAKGEPMPVKELARRIGKTPDMTSKHLAFLREMGMVMTKYSRIYQLVPALMPAAGATHLDFGHCLVKLDGAG